MKRSDKSACNGKYTHSGVFAQYTKEIGKISQSKYAEIFNCSRQNIYQRLNYVSYISNEEQSMLVNHLKKIGKTDTSLYKQFADTPNFVNVPIKSDVSASCGFGVEVYDEFTSENLPLPSQLLQKYFNADKHETEIIYAKGDSMSPDINDNDMILVDKSKTTVKDGQIYVFSYDGQPMCKELKTSGSSIIAISKNTNYPPFIIDKTLNFRIVGQVVGLFHSMF